MQADNYEFGLIKLQVSKDAGIFSCGDFAVYCETGGLQLGSGSLGPVFTTAIPPSADGMGNTAVAGETTSSWLNAMTFQAVWNQVIAEGRFRLHMWTAKVDPDAVFFPNRLLNRVRSHVSGPAGLYIRNCDKYPDIGMLGSLEVLSVQAVETYAAGRARCQSELKWQGWGEDYYVEHCLDLLGVGFYEGYDTLDDMNCHFPSNAPCNDAGMPAYHPFKAVGTYLACWQQAQIAAHPPTQAPVAPPPPPPAPQPQMFVHIRQ